MHSQHISNCGCHGRSYIESASLLNYVLQVLQCTFLNCNFWFEAVWQFLRKRLYMADFSRAISCLKGHLPPCHRCRLCSLFMLGYFYLLYFSVIWMSQFITPVLREVVITSDSLVCFLPQLGWPRSLMVKSASFLLFFASHIYIFMTESSSVRQFYIQFL
jgi:hypothetical protein